MEDLRKAFAAQREATSQEAVGVEVGWEWFRRIALLLLVATCCYYLLLLVLLLGVLFSMMQRHVLIQFCSFAFCLEGLSPTTGLIRRWISKFCSSARVAAKMVHPIITGIATGIGLLTDKYMLGATNFVEHYAVEFHATDAQKDFVKAAMYGGAILGMIVMGPLSDIIGRPGPQLATWPLWMTFKSRKAVNRQETWHIIYFSAVGSLLGSVGDGDTTEPKNMYCRYARWHQILSRSWPVVAPRGCSRRSGLILCSIITLLGALLSTFAWRENTLIVARIITGIGMGGEYPLASSHSAESSESGADDWWLGKRLDVGWRRRGSPFCWYLGFGFEMIWEKGAVS